jgi:hypothetical protein
MHPFNISEIAEKCLDPIVRVQLNHAIRQAAILKYIELRLRTYQFPQADITMYCKDCPFIGYLLSGIALDYWRSFRSAWWTSVSIPVIQIGNPRKIMIIGQLRRYSDPTYCDGTSILYTLPLMQMVHNGKFDNPVQRREMLKFEQLPSMDNVDNTDYILNGLMRLNGYAGGTFKEFKPVVEIKKDNPTHKIIYDTFSTYNMYRMGGIVADIGEPLNGTKVDKLIISHIKMELLKLEEYERVEIMKINCQLLGLRFDNENTLVPIFEWLDSRIS